MTGRIHLEMKGRVDWCLAAGDHRGRRFGIDSDLNQLAGGDAVAEMVAGSTGCVFVLVHVDSVFRGVEKGEGPRKEYV